MKKKKILALAFSTFAISTASLAFADSADAAKNMHRLYNPNSGEHFYTADTNEKNNILKHGWRYEGIAWTAPDSGNNVYRLYNPNSGEHHYTTGVNEKNHLVKVGWRYEGVGWKSDTYKGQALHRLYNPNGGAGSHHYTKDLNERNHLLKVGWRNENIGWYGMNPNQKFNVTIIHKGSDGKQLNKQTVAVKRDNNYTAKSKSFSGYTLKGNSSQTIKADGAKTITFNYTKNAVQKFNVTTIHKGSDGKELKKTTTAVEKGKSYTVKAESFSGYTLKGSNSQTVTVNANQTITFNYTKNPATVTKYKVTIKHVDSNDNRLLGISYESIEKGKSYTATAMNYALYTLEGSKTQTMTINKDTTITFKYKKEQASPDFYKVTVKHVGPNGELLSSSNENITAGQTYTANAKPFTGYTLTGSNTQTVKMDSDKTITFNYTKNPEPITKYKVTVNAMCDGQVIKTRSEMIEKGKQYTAFAEEIEGYGLNEYNVKTVTVNSDTIITFDYKKVELVDTFNLKIYVDDEYYTTLVKTIKKGESYQPSTKNLGLDENIYDLSNGVTYSNKEWIGGKTYDYEFDVYTYPTLSTAETNRLKSTIISKVNELRAQYSLAPVSEMAQLTTAATTRAQELHTVFDHIRPDRSGFMTVLDQNGINYGQCGENIAALYSTGVRDGEKLGTNLFNNWLDSAGHRATMLSSRYDKIGVGVYVYKNDVYATQLFID